MRKWLSGILAIGLLLSLSACGDKDDDGKKRKTQNNAELVYELTEDGQGYVVTDVEEMNGPDLIIPDTYQGVPVIAIAEYAIDYIDELESVTIGKNIQQIGYRAIYQCPNLKEITYNAVSCEDSENFPLDAIDAPKIAVTIGQEVQRIPAKLFGTGEISSIYASRITSLTFAKDSQCTEIGDNAFSNTLYVDALTLPYKLETIGEKAFYSSHTLTQVTLPATLTSIGYDAFKYCFKLAEVYNFSSLNIQVEGSENGRVAEYAVAVHTSEQTPSLLSMVGDYRFLKTQDAIYLIGYAGQDTDLTLPDNFQGEAYTIYTWAFYYSDIESVVIPAGVKGIESRAFGLCSNLKYATFADPEGWYYQGYSRDYTFKSDYLRDTVKAAEALSDGYDDETWMKK